MVGYEDFDNLTTKETSPLVTIRSITKKSIRIDDISHCSPFFLIGLYNKSSFIPYVLEHIVKDAWRYVRKISVLSINMDFDFANYAYSGLIGIFSAIVGMYYPLLLQAIDRIDEKYRFRQN